MVLVNKSDRTPQDLTRVGLDEEWEVSYWCERYGTTDSALRACVAKVGPQAVDVERYLRETGGGKQIFSNTGED